MSKWYDDAQAYWSSIQGNGFHLATDQGMLGGYEYLSPIDAASSLQFLSDVQGQVCCDCGAGIGRVTETVLQKKFKQVDLVEQEIKFLDAARQKLKGPFQFIHSGLQDFQPEKDRYDLIWCQWVLGHLTDQDFVAFFQRCKEAIKENGVIGVKENCSRSGVIFDEQDSSCTRPCELLLQLFDQAGLKVVKQEDQLGFPASLFPVKMFLLSRK